jgi:membrane protein YdbS with pleckstrin-like domain
VPFPRKLLTPGEEIVVEAHPNWSVLVRPAFITLVIVGGWTAITILWGSEPVIVGYLFAAVAAGAVLWFAGQLVAWRARLLVITTSRVIYRWGIVRRTGREIPLDRVQDVTYHQSLVERLAGAGSLTIESAGASGQEPFPDVRHPAQIQSLINQLITGDRGGWRRAAGPAQPMPTSAPLAPSTAPPQPSSQPPFGGWAGPPPEPAEPPTSPLPSVPFPQASAPVAPAAPASNPVGDPVGGALGDQLRDLERLHQAGVITDDEFDRKRKQVLGLD